MSGGRKSHGRSMRLRYRYSQLDRRCEVCGKPVTPEHPAPGVTHYRRLNGHPVHAECLAAYITKKGEDGGEEDRG